MRADFKRPCGVLEQHQNRVTNTFSPIFFNLSRYFINSGHPQRSKTLCIYTVFMLAASKPKLYNPRHPERTLLYQTVAEHYETWLYLASAGQFDAQGDHRTPKPYVHKAFGKYLECGHLCPRLCPRPRPLR